MKDISDPSCNYVASVWHAQATSGKRTFTDEYFIVSGEMVLAHPNHRGAGRRSD